MHVFGPTPFPAPPPLRHRRLHAVARRYLNPWVVRLGLAGGKRFPLGLVLHAGRRTGRSHATPLAVHRAGRHLYVPLTYGPGAHWCQNVLAAGACRVRLRGRTLPAIEPRVVRREALPHRLRVAYRLVSMREFLALTVPAGNTENRGSDGPPVRQVDR